ncbi:LysR family transcriptional regulator [Algiphilus sp. W345]|uniref:LysR family transcriptional regulator n=1 Tax=Banduia mediterranea TaxID=3075609 RepID=A0ABU2WJP5_9GAMM|nr:LysR family transcriptional regulator [Algiphilus sp. W345]MDT0498096.1 LysR family transcriptional regulator [Algiphilus sp. W345]
MSGSQFSIRSNFWLMVGDKSLAGRGRIELLERIAETGSIRQAAMAMRMSYRAAWDAVDAMNQRAAAPVVSRATGGRGGGGAVLTEAGVRLVNLFRSVEAEHARSVEQINERLAGLYDQVCGSA